MKVFQLHVRRHVIEEAYILVRASSPEHARALVDQLDYRGQLDHHVDDWLLDEVDISSDIETSADEGIYAADELAGAIHEEDYEELLA